MELPKLGEITQFDLVDRVGRIRLDDGTELRFGGGAMPGSSPITGMKVRVRAVAPHPLGGFKATDVERVLGGPNDEAIAAKQREVSLAMKEAQRLRDEPFERERLKQVAEAQAKHAEKMREEAAAKDAAREEAARAIGERTGLDAWRAALEHARLTKYAPRLLAAARATARLIAQPGAAAVGSSKLAGAPDLPAGFTWPTHHGTPLDFIAQIALAETPAEVRRSLGLPDAGLLAFFYAAREQPWGIDATERGSACIAYFPSSSVLSRATLPEELDGTFDEIALRLVSDVILPPLSGDAATAGLDLDEDEPGLPELVTELADLSLPPKALEQYAGAFAAYESVHDGFAHVFGGYAMPIQGAMEPICASIEPQSSASDWRLVLQLDSGADVGEWGDDGRLYFWARASDLRTCDFTRAWCILQSH